MVKILVDGREIEGDKGMTLLQTCLANGIYIPNLCYLHGMEDPPVSCRMCFVELNGGEEGPVPSCTVRITDSMSVKTDTPDVRRLQRSSLKLLLSVHRVDCGHCPANKKCELQRMARFLKMGLKPGPLDQFLKDPEVDETHPILNYHPNRCVLCGRCVHICQAGQERPFLAFARRGFETIISFYGHRKASRIPEQIHKDCVEICPVGALTLRSQEAYHREMGVREKTGPAHCPRSMDEGLS